MVRATKWSLRNVKSLIEIATGMWWWWLDGPGRVSKLKGIWCWDFIPRSFTTVTVVSVLSHNRLVLPYERHRRGEEDKPLPPSKPRKQYKRSEEGKGKNESKKRRRGDGDDPEVKFYKKQNKTHTVFSFTFAFRGLVHNKRSNVVSVAKYFYLLPYLPFHNNTLFSLKLTQKPFRLYLFDARIRIARSNICHAEKYHRKSDKIMSM